MKYLAVTLGLLCAASAHSAGKYKYVPTNLTINYSLWEADIGFIIPQTSQVVDLSNPTITIQMKRENDTGADIPLKYSHNEYTNPNTALITSSGASKYPSSLRITPNTDADVSIVVSNPFSTGAKTTLYLPANKYLSWPTTPSSVNQSIRVECAVPEYVTSDQSNLTEVVSSMNLYLSRSGNFSCTNCVIARGSCNYEFEIVPEINLEIKNGHMHIRGVSGTPTIATNQIIATGWGGRVPASLRIDNPYKEDLSISFSQTDFDQTTTTVNPTETGAQTDFYVKVNNTTPGSREYRVNFTAQFV